MSELQSRELQSAQTGRSFISVPQYDAQTNRTVIKDVPTLNAATLRKDDWKMVDQAVVTAARPRLRFFGDLIQAGLEVRIPNALGKMVWQCYKSFAPLVVVASGNEE